MARALILKRRRTVHILHTHAAYMYKKQLINSCSTLFGQAKRTNLLHYLRRRRESLSICAFDHTVPHAHRDRTASRLEVGTNQAKA
jgi:hypothetical protein